MANRKPEDKICPFLSIFGEGMAYCIGERCALFGETGCALTELVALQKAARAEPSLNDINRRIRDMAALSPEHRQLVRDLEGVGPVRPTDPSGDLTPEELEAAMEGKPGLMEFDPEVDSMHIGEEIEGPEIPIEKPKAEDPFRIKEISKKNATGGKGGRR